MIGMILADFYAMKKQLAMLGAMGALYLCIGIVSGSEHAIIAFFVLFSVMSVISSFTYNEQCRFDLFANTLPIGRHSIVLGKYVMVVISLGIADILGGICLGISRLMKHGDISEDIYVLVFTSLIGILFTSIALPMIFKLGSERAKFVLIAIYVLPFLAAFALTKYGIIDLDQFINVKMGQMLLFLVCGDIILMGISVAVSLGIYKRKEF